MKKFFYLLCTTLFTSISSVGNSITETSYLDKLLHRFANSSFVTQFNDFVSEAPSKYNTKEASQELQELGKLAQERVGIPQEQRVSILETVSNESFFAEAHSNAIVVNQKHQEKSCAVKRCNMYHEAVHVKYKDYAVGSIFKLGASILGLTLGFVATKKFTPKGYFKLLYPIAMFSAAYASQKRIGHVYKKHSERRADREGHYATACSECVAQKADDIAGYLEEFKHIYDTKDERISYLDQQVQDGKMEKTQSEYFKSTILGIPEQIRDKTTYYLSPEENREIARILKQENKLCDFHKQNK